MDTARIQSLLDQFEVDPVSVLEGVPEKIPPSGPQLAPPVFDSQSAQDGSFVSRKKSIRKQLNVAGDDGGISVEEQLLAPPAENDRAERLVDQVRHTTLEEIEKAGLRQTSLAETPWSDDYWPIYRGMLGCRYADPQFPGRGAGWTENRDYVTRDPAQAVAARGDAAAIGNLSPSEKYDLLVGDPAGTLTASMWAQGEWYMKKYGAVETWMGLCHGWAPASYMLPSPRHSVTAVSPDGLALRFFPSDIKSLATLLWANASPGCRFIGSRAEEKNPAVDENGRVTSQAAFDTNPATWHLSVVNQLGGKRSFVMDAQFDYQVWNQPVCSYEYSYFNAQEGRVATSLRDATVAREAFTNDKFAKFRSAQMRAVVGVAMQVGYVVETIPNHDEVDAPGAVTAVDYLYDLELDAAGRIIGGEWLRQAHPDFLWTPPANAQASTPADRHASGPWAIGEPLPESWQSAARLASTYQQPLAKIVNALIAAARA